MRISFIGKFDKIYDEEYIARSFESLGHEVQRISDGNVFPVIPQMISQFQPDLVLFTKLYIPNAMSLLEFCKKNNYPTASWVFDLYFGYNREFRVFTSPNFKADMVFTTDGGHSRRWEEVGIKHHLVRQGIYAEECFLFPVEKKEHNLVFVGSDNSAYQYRAKTIRELERSHGLKWFGRRDTNEMRSLDLNRLYSKTKVVVGDSYYSPHYWSNRVVETLGRGGFLIHQEVDGLKEEYPHIVTYKREDSNDLKEKIDYYITHDEEREEIVKKNFAWVKERYTMDKKCNELLTYV